MANSHSETTSLSLLYKVSGDKVISANELVQKTPRANFTMKASKEYLAIVGGDDGARALPHIDIVHLMQTDVLVQGTKTEHSLRVPRVKPSVAFDKDASNSLIVVGGWLDPRCRDFAFSAESIDVATGQTLRRMDFTRAFSKVPDARGSAVDVFFQSGEG